MKKIAAALSSVLFVSGVGACSNKKAADKPVDKPVAAAPGAPSAPAKPTAAPAGKVKPVADMSKLAFDKKDWDPEFNTALKDWTFEKYTQVGDDNSPSRFVATQPDDDAPASVDEYATKLGVKDFQDIGFRYTAIASKAALPNGGWVIKGTVVTDPPMDGAKPEPGFVALVDVGGSKFLCKSETMVSDKMVDEALEICKSAK